jgi:hypothetical protein
MSVETIGDLAREASIDHLVTGLATFGPAYTRNGEPKSTRINNGCTQIAETAHQL